MAIPAVLAIHGFPKVIRSCLMKNETFGTVLRPAIPIHIAI